MRRLLIMMLPIRLFTRNGKLLTLKGIETIFPFVQDFKNLYLLGAFSPINGDKLLLETPYCKTDCIYT